MHFIRKILFSSLLVVALALSGCASITSKPLKPTVELIRVKPLNISLREQKLRFDLKVSNPNPFDMPIEAIDFIARFNNNDIASGKSFQAVTIAAESDTTVSLYVTAELDQLVHTITALLKSEAPSLKYQLTGSVEIASWPKPFPFDVIGAMDVNDS